MKPSAGPKPSTSRRIVNCAVMFRGGPFLDIFQCKSPKLATQSVIVAALISSLGAAAACGRAARRKEGRKERQRLLSHLCHIGRGRRELYPAAATTVLISYRTALLGNT